MSAHREEAVTALDPIAYWRLGERSGTTAVDETGRHPGTYRNGVAIGAAGVESGNSAAAFDGRNDYLEVPHSSAFLLDSGTLQLWFNTDSAGQTQTLFSKDADRFGTGGHLSGWLEDGEVIIRLQSEGESHTIRAGAIQAGEWTHLAFSWGEGGMALYLDGVLVGTDRYTGGLAGNQEPLVFGASQRRSSEKTADNLEDFFDGRIDEISLHDEALTASEIAALAAVEDGERPEQSERPEDEGSGGNPAPEPDPEPDPGSEPDPDTGPEPEPEPDTGSDPDPEPDPDTGSDPDPAPPAGEEEGALRVGPGQPFRTLADAVAASQPGDTILVEAGVYESDYSTIRHALTIKGVGGIAHLKAVDPIANGKAILVAGADLTLENIKFSDARVPDRNGAGIRHESGDLVIQGSIFENNENGILSAPNASASVTIRGSEFIGNGAGDGRTHGIYVNQIARLDVDDSSFRDTKVGHHIKSRALETSIRESLIDDGRGNASYSVDLPNGGRALLEGNTLIQSAETENTAMVAYGAEGNLHGENSFLIKDNRFIDHHPSGKGIHNHTDTVIILQGNTFEDVETEVVGPHRFVDAGAPDTAPETGPESGPESGPDSGSDPGPDDSADNTPPAAADDSASTGENTAVVIDVLANDSDADGDALAITGFSQGTAGSVAESADGKLVYTPSSGFFGKDAFTYTISDGNGGSSEAAVDVTVTSDDGGNGSEGGAGNGSDSTGGSGSSAGGDPGAGGSAPPVAGGLPSVRLQAPSGALMPGEMVSFGQAFARGEVPAGSGLLATAGGKPVPLQMDVKATHADGSVRHAILTLAVPDGSGSTLDVTLDRGSGGGSADPAAVARDLLAGGYDLKVTITSGGQSETVDAAAALSEALSQGLDVWMQGDLATEFRVESEVGNGLLATFDIRAYANGEVRTDVTIHNDRITAKDGLLHQPAALTYDVAIEQGGRTVFTHNTLDHHQNANWHTQVWADGSGPNARVVRDLGHLANTGAVPAIDSSIAVSESTLQDQWNALQKSDTGPMGSALWTTYMPTTGGRFDIGMVTGWQALYLAGQDPRAEAIILKMADVAGSVPWHLRDAATGDTLTIDDHPGFTTYERNGVGADRLAAPYSTEGTGWEPDGAHQPAMSYLPYLITGDRYYLDELHAEANYHITGTLYERNGADGLFYLGQIRGQAWALRSLGAAAYITPDDDPLKDYFADKLGNNIDYQRARDLSAAGEVEGYILDEIHGGSMAPWQDDFYTAVLAQLAMQGDESAAELMEWKVNFTAGRFLAEEQGFNPLAGTNYYMFVADGSREPWRLFDSWAEVYDTFVAENGAPTALLENYIGGYADIARGTLANLISGTGDPRAIEAYGFLVGETQQKFAGGVGSDPTWAIAPRLADGSVLGYDDITVGGDGGQTLTGGAGSQLLHGKAGNDTIAGGGGIDLVFGGDGADTLSGGEGNDFLFGGKGDDRLDGGPGNDFLKGGAGADTFQFARQGGGRDTVADFTAGVDRLAIGGLGSADLQALIAGASADPNGDAVLHLSADDDITLLGISSNSLEASWFLLP